jgi:hypothetical protein
MRPSEFIPFMRYEPNDSPIVVDGLGRGMAGNEQRGVGIGRGSAHRMPPGLPRGSLTFATKPRFHLFPFSVARRRLRRRRATESRGANGAGDVAGNVNIRPGEPGGIASGCSSQHFAT